VSEDTLLLLQRMQCILVHYAFCERKKRIIEGGGNGKKKSVRTERVYST